MSTKSLTPRIARALLASVALAACAHAAADWKQLLEKAMETPAAGGTGASAALAGDEVVAGLKEALARGAEQAVAQLGRPDGFLGNGAVKIPLPESLQPVDSMLRTLGQGRYADEFVTTMNRAAERAVPESGPILGDAIRNMTVDEAKQILDGPDDAATAYFRRVSEERLSAALRPLVSDATAQAGVTGAYKQLMRQAGPAASLAGADLGDIDGYVTRETLDGLFTVIAAEEKRIRENPAARTTELLQKVFGAAR